MSEELGREVRGSHDAASLDPSWAAHPISSDKSILERTGVAPRPESSEKQPEMPSISELHARSAGAVTSDNGTGVDFEGPGSQYRWPSPRQDSSEEVSEPLSLAERMGFVRRPKKSKTVASDSSISERMQIDRRPAVSNPNEIVE